MHTASNSGYFDATGYFRWLLLNFFKRFWVTSDEDRGIGRKHFRPCGALLNIIELV